MKKLLSSLIILTLIISSFSCVAFADGEKNWHLPMVDFSSADDIVTSTANTFSGFNSNTGWYANESYYVYDAQAQNIVTKPNQYSAINAGFGGNKVLVTEESEKYFVFKGQFYGNNRDAIRTIFYDGTNGWSYIRGTELFRIGGLNIYVPGTSTKLISVNDYYDDSWVDVVVVVDMTYDATTYTADIYANGQKATTTLDSSFATYVKSESNQMIGVDFRGLWSPRDTARMDNTGVYTVDRNKLPALTASLNGYTITISNEVTLANLSKDTTTSLVKLNGEYLPLSAIKANKGGLSFEIDESAVGYGENTVDVSEVKDIFGSSVSGTSTFTITKEMPKVEVADDAVTKASYEDGNGTKTQRFFANIDKLDYAEAGFEVSATYEGVEYVWEIALNEVYNNVIANDVEYNASNYVLTGAIGEIPLTFEGDFGVKVYTKNYEGEKSYID